MVDALLIAAFFLIVALLSGVRRDGTMRPGHAGAAFAALGLLVAFGLGSWLLGASWGIIGSAAEGLTRLGVPPLVVIVGPALLVALLGMLARRQRSAFRAPVATPAADASRYESDPRWYKSKWRKDPNNPDHDLGTDGIPFELEDGPLVHRVGRLRDSRFSLWVTLLADGTHAVWGGMKPPATVPKGGQLLGAYVFSEAAEGMVWTPSSVHKTSVL